MIRRIEVDFHSRKLNFNWSQDLVAYFILEGKLFRSLPNQYEYGWHNQHTIAANGINKGKFLPCRLLLSFLLGAIQILHTHFYHVGIIKQRGTIIDSQ